MENPVSKGQNPLPGLTLPGLRGLRVGLLAPLDSLRFLKDHKFLMFIGLAPQLVGLVLFVWLAASSLLPTAEAALLSLLPASWDGGFFAGLVTIVMSLLLLVAYAVLWVPLVSTLASPLYDVVAGRTYEELSGVKLPAQGLLDMLRGMVSEAVKLTVYFLLIVLGLLLPPLSPFIIAFSIWYLGWDLMDRTLLLTGRSFRERVGFGLRNWSACLALGMWVYIPLVGAILGFAFACAGALSVAQLEAGRSEGPPSRGPIA